MNQIKTYLQVQEPILNLEYGSNHYLLKLSLDLYPKNSMKKVGAENNILTFFIEFWV
jgi:hypothetical protein